VSPDSWPGGLVALRAGSAGALVAPGVGANCVAFTVGGRDVLERPSSPDELMASPARAGCPILFPFPGRLPGGRYRFDGREFALPLNSLDGGAHAHGFTPRRAWRLERRTAAMCACAFDESCLTPEEKDGYPWAFVLQVRWSVQAAGVLRAHVQLKNRSLVPLPFGLGLHPYLLVPPEASIDVPATAAWPNTGGVPFGPPGPTAGPWPWVNMEPGASVLLTGLARGTAAATAGDAVLRFPADRFGEVVLYRPPARASVCVEPWTSVSAAGSLIEVGSPSGLLRLPAGATWRAWAEIGVSRSS
jgi:aldose 1-epimerase